MPYRYIVYFDLADSHLTLQFESPYNPLTIKEREKVARIICESIVGATYQYSEEGKHG